MLIYFPGVHLPQIGVVVHLQEQARCARGQAPTDGQNVKEPFHAVQLGFFPSPYNHEPIVERQTGIVHGRGYRELQKEALGGTRRGIAHGVHHVRLAWNGPGGQKQPKGGAHVGAGNAKQEAVITEFAATRVT